ncbi:portal protein [Vibrio phage D81]
MNKEKMKLQYVPTPGVIKILDSAQQAMITTDGLSNVVAGLGGGSDKRTYNRWSHKNDPFNNFSELEALYRNSWLAKQIVDVPANDATREWRSFKGDHADAIAKEEKRLKVKTLSNDWIKNSRLYGGGLMLMITGQDLAQPLNVKNIGKGDLKKLIVFDRWYLSGTALNVTNPLSENFLQSEYYFLAGTGQAIHHSHICRLDGTFLPLRLNQYEQGFGDSVLRKCQQDISDVSSTNANIANLVFSANVDTIKRKGLFAALASGEDQKIINRYSKLNLLKSTINLTLLDEDETYERNQLAFSGLPQIQQMQMQWISGAADIPMTRLFGSSPGGLNATGESDLTNYYDGVKSDQEGQYREGLEQLDQVMLRSAGVPSEKIDEVEFEWNPLYQDSNTEKATQRLAEAQADMIYLEQGVITEAQVAKRLQSNGDYSIEDADISELESMRDENEEALRIENEELRNQAAANEDDLKDANERADKAIADANETIIMVRKNFDTQTEKSKREADKLVSDALAKLDETKAEYEQKITDAAVIHKQTVDQKIAELTAQFESETNDKQVVFDKAIEAIKTEYEQKTLVMEDEHAANVKAIEDGFNAESEKLNKQITDAKLEAEDKVKAAQKERDKLVADAEALAEQSINEANEQNVVDIQTITDGVNKNLADLKAQYDKDLQKVKDEAEQTVESVKAECDQKIADSEAKSNDRINEIESEMNTKIEESKLQTEVILDAVRAEAYKVLKEKNENQDDEVVDGDQSNGNIDGSDEAEPREPKGDGEATPEDENAKTDGAE